MPSVLADSRNFEDDFSIPDEPVVFRENYVIISGCSGSGKSTLLTELCQKGFSCVPEPGRQIVKEQISIEGNGLPWTNPLKFMDLTLSRYIYNFNVTQNEPSKWIFFDRGIPDAVSHIEYLGEEVPLYLHNAVKKFRYHPKVFMTPPWPEIYRTDAERQHNLQDSIAVYESSVKTFEKYGYEIITVPKDQVQNRVKFILNYLDKH